MRLCKGNTESNGGLGGAFKRTILGLLGQANGGNRQRHDGTDSEDKFKLDPSLLRMNFGDEIEPQQSFVDADAPPYGHPDAPRRESSASGAPQSPGSSYGSSVARRDRNVAQRRNWRTDEILL